MNITDFITARLDDLLAERGQEREYREARGGPCPRQDCNRPIDSITIESRGVDAPKHYFVFHDDKHHVYRDGETGHLAQTTDRTRHEITLEDHVRISCGGFTPDAVFTQRLVASFQAILDGHRDNDGECSTCISDSWGCACAGGDVCRSDCEAWPCPTILALAGVWSDHADYDPAWSAK